MQFSVIIPVFNVEEYLEKCVNSVLQQTYSDFEVLLIDDGSTDSSSVICDCFAERDKRVRVIHKANGGLVSARNTGIMNAIGDYICYVDGDDWTHPNMLQFVHNQLENYSFPLDMVIFGAYNIFNDRVGQTKNSVDEGLYDKARLEKEVYPFLFSDRRRGFREGRVIEAYTWNKVCRRGLQVECYVRDEQIRVFTDVPLTYECLLKSYNVYICNEKLYYYNRTNSHSILALGGRNCLTPSFNHLVSYLRQRLSGFSPDIDRQLNDYPVSLIIRTAMASVREQPSFFKAKKIVRQGLNESRMLEFVSLRGLPINPKIFMLFFKLHFDTLAMILCVIKVYSGKK